jgi:hypothetical protein
VRVYLPSSPQRLRDAVEHGQLGGPPIPGHAVTAALPDAVGTQDEEELEFAAMTAASLDSVRLLGPGDLALRVVTVVEVADAVVRTEGEDPGQEPSAVVIDAPVPLRRLVAVHVDSDAASATVAAARDVPPGDAAEEEALDRCLDRDLEWYAPSEVTALLERWDTAH